MIHLENNYSTTKMLVQSNEKNNSLLLPSTKYRKYEGGLRTKGYFKKTYDDKPLISIITVVFNGAKYIEKTIQSVINQTYENVDYIIIDGGSTDETINIIKKYENQIDYWISEKDAGISDAFNKGINIALGDFIGIINSDDFYTTNNIFTEIAKCVNSDIVYGDIIKLYGHKMVELSSNNNALENLKYCNMKSIFHPTFFVKKNIYMQYGLFNVEYKLAMDYEFLLRLDLDKIKVKYLDKFIVSMRTFGISDIYNYQAKLEVIRAYKIHYNIKFNDFNTLIAYYFTLRSYVGFLLRKTRLGRFVIDKKNR